MKKAVESAVESVKKGEKAVNGTVEKKSAKSDKGTAVKSEKSGKVEKSASKGKNQNQNQKSQRGEQTHVNGREKRSKPST